MAKSRTKKVREVLGSIRTKSMIEAGYTDQEIIEALGISKRILKTFKKNIAEAKQNLVWVL